MAIFIVVVCQKYHDQLLKDMEVNSKSPLAINGLATGLILGIGCWMLRKTGISKLLMLAISGLLMVSGFFMYYAATSTAVFTLALLGYVATLSGMAFLIIRNSSNAMSIASSLSLVYLAGSLVTYYSTMNAVEYAAFLRVRSG